MNEEKDIWWLNEESEQILNRGYLLKGESVEGAIDRITSAAAHRLYKPELQPAFKEMITKGWISFSSPIEGITHKLGEVIMQTKIGGGTSGYFGELRSRGSAVTDNGKSSGAVSFMKLFDSAMDVVSQGGVRRGAFAAYLDIDHPDAEEFLQIKDVEFPIQNLFFGICVPDYWMQEMIDGDVEKRRLWARVLESRQQKGLPYIRVGKTIRFDKAEINRWLQNQ